MNNDKRFSDLWEDEIAGWRALPISRLLEEHLEAERKMALETIAGHLVTGDAHTATVASGGHEVLASLLQMFHPRERPPEAQETKFVDPVDVRRI